MHRAGAGALKHLLKESGAVPPTVLCDCGQQAKYRERRSRNVLTAVGPVRFERAYYRCDWCRQGLSPRDRELDVAGTDYSPGVRRMMAVVGSDASFDQGREQMELLAGLEVTRKAVERHAEAIGADIAKSEEVEIQRAVQLDLPEVTTSDIPVLYIEMDGTGVPVTAAETEGRKGKTGDEPAHTREVKLGCVFTQTSSDKEGKPVRDENSTTYTGAIETAAEFGRRMYNEAWQRGWNRAAMKVILADGAIWIWNIADENFPAPSRSSTFTMPANTCGYLPGNSSRPMRNGESVGPAASRRDWKRAKSNFLSNSCVPFTLPRQRLQSCCAWRPTTLNGTADACDTRSFAARNSSSAPALLKQAAEP